LEVDILLSFLAQWIGWVSLWPLPKEFIGEEDSFVLLCISPFSAGRKVSKEPILCAFLNNPKVDGFPFLGENEIPRLESISL
jgi:hypothetical protein